MTIYGHNKVMISVKVSELKAKLSAYLARVKRGETVIVADRNTPIARLAPFETEADDLAVIKSSSSPAELRRIRGVRPKKAVNVDKLLEELRRDR